VVTDPEIIDPYGPPGSLRGPAAMIAFALDLVTAEGSHRSFSAAAAKDRSISATPCSRRGHQDLVRQMNAPVQD
jgi:hypothetical protein